LWAIDKSGDFKNLSPIKHNLGRQFVKDEKTIRRQDCKTKRLKEEKTIRLKDDKTTR
jgi:hypothetical protein